MNDRQSISTVGGVPGDASSTIVPLQYSSRRHEPAPYRPFSPSAIAANSGKRIKAFFQHRSPDSDDDNAGGRGVPLSPFSLRRMSSRISSDSFYESKVGRARDLPPIPVDTSGRPGKQSLPTTNVRLSGNADRGRNVAEERIRFPRTEKDVSQSVNTQQEGVIVEPRKPKRSLSLFRSASKTKPVANVSGSATPGIGHDTRIGPDTLKIQRPTSAPISRNPRPSTSTEVKTTVAPRVTVEDITRPAARSSPRRDNSQVQSSKTSTVSHNTDLERRGSPFRSSTPRQKPTATHPKSTFPPSTPAELEPSERTLYSVTPDAATPVPSSRHPTPTGRDSSNDVDREAHYLLRMASTYLAKTVMPEARVTKNKDIGNQEVQFVTDRSDVLRRHVYEKIKLLERMERAWGIEWMLRGKEGFVVSESRKEKERDCFRRVVDDGVVLCFLLMRVQCTRSSSGSSILLSVTGASKHNLELAVDMTKTVPLNVEDVRLTEEIEHLGGRGVYAAARLVVALARMAGPQRKEATTDDLDLSSPTSDSEEQLAKPEPQLVAPPTRRLLDRPPLLIRRLSSKSSTSGATTPKQTAPLQLSTATDAMDHTSIMPPAVATSSNELPVKRQPVLMRRTPESSAEGDFAMPTRRPILRVKQSFASSVTSENTSTADSKSRASVWRPRFAPDHRDDDLVSGSVFSMKPLSAASIAASSPRAVSFGRSDEHAQQQVKSFRSATRTNYRAAEPSFSRESSACKDALADEEDDFPLASLMHRDFRRHSRNTSLSSQRLSSEINSSAASVLSSPSRRFNLQTKASGPHRPISPSQSRVSRPTSLVSTGASSTTGVFPGTPPRTPRNQPGIWPQSAAGSRRTSFASTTGDSPGSRISRQVIEVLVNGKRKANYQIGNCIGKGQFGMVFRALDLSSGQFVAIKRIDIKGTSNDEVVQIMREVDLLQRLRHPGIVRYLGMAKSEDCLDIVLEFIEGGSLAHSVKSFGELNEDLVAGYVAKILEGLNYLHSQDVVHCDLKAANILTTKTGNIKLSDFGVSLNLRAVGQSKEDVVGSPNWMAPEVIELKGITTAADIWSLGATVIELITGRPPYHDMDNGMAVMYRIVDDGGPPIPEYCSADLKNFLDQCFHKEPARRPSAEDLFEHVWVKSRVSLDPKLRHQDSIPFLRRISTDAFRLHAEHKVGQAPVVFEHDTVHREPPFDKQGADQLDLTLAHGSPMHSPNISSNTRVPSSPVRLHNNEKSGNPEILDRISSEQARQVALERLVGAGRIPTRPESRSRIFSFSSRKSVERPLPTSTTSNTLSSSEASIQLKTPKPAKAPLGSPDVSPKSSSFLFSHDSEKYVREEPKSDCNLM
ncbi:hypothetical protein QFC22_001363 [Naganishia vaughanmartiniae]|uniref:Uncharacterized protein n=1 Tax=Naganishia vaughanmartiniae TaxID=1424756 RepID=A0ACC2XHU8_9TREE|nr:hypothetical protein QFC22_001363 [Naganishia vaughanmartiniae]